MIDFEIRHGEADADIRQLFRSEMQAMRPHLRNARAGCCPASAANSKRAGN